MRYLRPSELITINRILTGDPGVGDEGYGVGWARLKDATDRPQEASKLLDYEVHPNIHEKAAAFLESMLKNPPFERQNAATAVLGLFVFYRENGRELDIDDRTLLDYIDKGTLPQGFANLAVFLGRHDAA